MSVRSGKDGECARYLFSQGADICHQDNDGRSPLHSYYNPITKIVFPWNETDLWAQDDFGMTPLHYICWSMLSTPNDVALYVRLASSGSSTAPRTLESPLVMRDEIGRSVLHFATQTSNTELMEYLLSQPEAKSISSPDFSGMTLLHYAAECPCPDALDYLISLGYDTHAVDNRRWTLMHHAVANDCIEVVKRLSELGLENQFTLLDVDDRNPMQLALKMHSNSVIEYLRQRPMGDISCKTEILEKSDQMTAIKVDVSMRSWLHFSYSVQLLVFGLLVIFYFSYYTVLAFGREQVALYTINPV